MKPPFSSPPADSYCLLAGSPRRGGNTDTAAALVQEVLLHERKQKGQLWRVADALVQPCISCGYCDTHPGQCPLMTEYRLPGQTCQGLEDQAMPLLHALCSAATPCIVAPIYFYHVPAYFKGLLDRAQAYWTMPPEHKPGQNRQLGVILLGARAQGEKLFSGALLTIQYVGKALGLRPLEPLLLYELDQQDALSHQPNVQERILAYARSLPPA